ncbi:chloramphenicol-sensitive protein RarD [Paenibacillus sophorae]|uniref:Chloramphenicol-sensitive protein RarD n=1 Tax=Paenibacillus sophorae TaxID=1333845 RepID=A0A1H8T455_9BACL|nr:EamA family transporter RarD [Paenibacillus sophorae]QWU17087.1 EamA family transporter RarD [Paenibacillus sophorae]SEO85727.1 chloramphenicol-sensitive protein RarD [Paenibacillus sophorae]
MKKGIIYAVLAYLTWGFLPLYWRLFTAMPAWEILAQRITWSFVFVAVLVTVSRQWRRLKSVGSNRRSAAAIVLCSIFISLNWFLFIWAVNNNHVIETSLGYYMNPLISVLFAVVFLRERLSPGQWLSLFLAGLGVLIMAVQYGHIPWVAISLAVSFALYGLAKKIAKLDVLLGLAGETIVALPVALGYLFYIQSQGTGTFTSLPPFSIILLLLSGAATAMPLFWFAKSMQLLPLSFVGFFQYIAPTTSLLLAIFLFNEPFSEGNLISFSLIWLALIIYSFVTFKKSKVKVVPISRADAL